MNNMDSLRVQIISAMDAYASTRGWADRSVEFNTEMFDNAIMPVLDAAMKAGELLVHRATTPQKPVNDAIISWLQRCSDLSGRIQQKEATVSRREILSILYHLLDDAAKALADARQLSMMCAIYPETTSGDRGNPLAGLTSPLKG